MKRRRALLAGIGLIAGAGLGALVRLRDGEQRETLLRPPGALPEPDFLAACPPEYATLHLFSSSVGAAARAATESA